MRELSLRPYNGRLFLANSREDYEKGSRKLFTTPDVLTCGQVGHFSGGEGKDGLWTYIIWATDMPRLAHELSHVILHTFERCGINPIEAGGEPFCYMLSQLLIDSDNGPR